MKISEIVLITALAAEAPISSILLKTREIHRAGSLHPIPVLLFIFLHGAVFFVVIFNLIWNIFNWRHLLLYSIAYLSIGNFLAKKASLKEAWLISTTLTLAAGVCELELLGFL